MLWGANTFNRLSDPNSVLQTISFLGFSIIFIINYDDDSFSYFLKIIFLRSSYHGYDKII